MYNMSATQSQQEIHDILDRIVGETVSGLQVLGINSLKSVTPAPADLTGLRIESAAAEDRVLELRTRAHSVTLDLQRTGRLVWHEAPLSRAINLAVRPTVRLLLESGSAVDFTEPAKTKRITVRISPTSAVDH